MMIYTLSHHNDTARYIRENLLVDLDGSIQLCSYRYCNYEELPNYFDCIDFCESESPFSLHEVAIPSSVTSLGNSIFCDCLRLNEALIPSSVTCIESHSFGGCSSLTEASIPSSVTCIESHSFGGCSSLTEISLPSSVACIESHAFSGCSSLTEISLPFTIDMIGVVSLSIAGDIQLVQVIKKSSNSAFSEVDWKRCFQRMFIVGSNNNFFFCDFN